MHRCVTFEVEPLKVKYTINEIIILLLQRSLNSHASRLSFLAVPPSLRAFSSPAFVIAIPASSSNPRSSIGRRQSQCQCRTTSSLSGRQMSLLRVSCTFLQKRPRKSNFIQHIYQVENQCTLNVHDEFMTDEWDGSWIIFIRLSSAFTQWLSLQDMEAQK